MKRSILFYYIKTLLSILLFYSGSIFLLKLFFSKRESLLILNYHNFSKYNNYKIKRGNIQETGYADNFEKQMRFYKKHFNFCYPEDFFAGKCAKGINVLITFDDGYKDNYDIALPILEKYKAAAVFFITTNFIGSNNWLWHDKVRYLVVKGKMNANEAEHQLKKMNLGFPVDIAFKNKIETLFHETPKRLIMSWEEVKQLSDNGFVIGAHTANHRILDSLDENEQRNEIKPSINKIKENLQIKTEHFAFPNGLYNETTLDILKNNKIKYAYTTKNGFNKFENCSKVRLKRIGINASDTIDMVLLKLLRNAKK
ncbi:polysaccharide deacetylase family protein [Maribellus luteus]|uniref:Polysaccharide deacetylase family protein n=1 Tax=Maribellus luteus TaxID=2305463 RepID=A0A399SY51_9BACT|nr:polysaccharide deacetylase family protein [Maribellus luteus]RIJ47609.1 polysaccharide deacetylase family protein [Maribellus luteus]